MSANGLQDVMLSSLLDERRELRARQQEAGSLGVQAEDLTEQAASLDAMIGERSRGILFVLAAQADEALGPGPHETTPPEPSAGPPSSAPSVTPPRLDAEAIAKAREAMRQKVAMLGDDP